MRAAASFPATLIRPWNVTIFIRDNISRRFWPRAKRGQSILDFGVFFWFVLCVLDWRVLHTIKNKAHQTFMINHLYVILNTSIDDYVNKKDKFINKFFGFGSKFLVFWVCSVRSVCGTLLWPSVLNKRLYPWGHLRSRARNATIANTRRPRARTESTTALPQPARALFAVDGGCQWVSFRLVGLKIKISTRPQQTQLATIKFTTNFQRKHFAGPKIIYKISKIIYFLFWIWF